MLDIWAFEKRLEFRSSFCIISVFGKFRTPQTLDIWAFDFSHFSEVFKSSRSKKVFFDFQKFQVFNFGKKFFSIFKKTKKFFWKKSFFRF